MDKRKESLRSLKRFGLVVLGSAVLGLGAGFFLGPNSIVTGGLTGIGIILQSLFGLNLDLTVLVLQVIFFLLGWVFLGKNMALKTIVATIVYPLTLALGGYLATFFPDFFVPLAETTALGGTELVVGGLPTVNCVLSAVFGGVLVGTGVGLTFLGGGSTGGVDILVLIIQKFTKVKTSTITFLIDGSIVVVGLISLKRIDMMLIGVVSAFITSIMIDRIFDTEDNVIVSVISKKYDKINSIILEKLDRGSTIVNAIGGYSQKDVKMLQVVLGIREYYLLKEIIAQEDPEAFMYMTKVSSVHGEGFKAHSTTVPNLGKKKNGSETEEI